MEANVINNEIQNSANGNNVPTGAPNPAPTGAPKPTEAGGNAPTGGDTPQRSNEQTFTRTIVEVQTIRDDSTRLRVVVDGEEFESITPEGKVIMTNAFSLTIGALLHQCAPSCAPLKAVLALAGGRRDINPQVFGLSLVGGKATFKRMYHAQGELRRDGTPYTSECYTTEITKVVPVITPIESGLIMAMLQDQTKLFTNNQPKAISAEDAAASIFATV